MDKKKKRGGFLKPLLMMLVVFGPASILVLITMGKCEHNFTTLPIYSEMPDYEFVGAGGEVINNKTQEGKVTLFTTIQTTCPQNCAIDIFKFNLQIYQDYRKNQKSLGHVKIVSVVTDQDGNPVDNIDELLFTMNDMIEGYDSTIWNLVTGDPKQIYDIENNGVNLYSLTSDSTFAGKSYLETMLIVDKQNQLRLVRRGNQEGLIRDYKQHVALLQKQYDKNDKLKREAKEN
ncbi:SCO family protein [Brumimicrobium mesophilum]|uniref:SCO family protein n=1 Tax=Brumimicrobium mesophilum TaxID=392717 RepID=UPI00131B67AF|nr:SCO family protein [Brumimicrobium mesophilum]